MLFEIDMSQHTPMSVHRPGKLRPGILRLRRIHVRIGMLVVPGEYPCTAMVWAVDTDGEMA
jgi:hypothetical protein